MSLPTELGDFVENINDRLEDAGARVKAGNLHLDDGDFILNFKVIAHDEVHDAVERILNVFNERVDDDSREINFNDETPNTHNTMTDTFQLKVGLFGDIDLFDM